MAATIHDVQGAHGGSSERAGLNHRIREAAHAGLGGRRATVTVVIPCFNYARFLTAAVESVLGQEGVDVDVIVVDDESTDNTPEVAKELAVRWPRIRYIRHDENKGPVGTFNDGAKIARGEFLVRLDADDLLTPGSLKRSVAVARNHPSVGLVYGHPLHFEGFQPPPSRSTATSWTIWPGREWLAERCHQGRNVITSPEVLMRRSVVELVGYQAPLRHSHDMEHWLRISAFSDVAYIHGADQAWHRDHDDSLSAREVDGIVDLEQRMEAFDMLFHGVAGQIPGATRLHQAARQALASAALAAASHALDTGSSRAAAFGLYLDQAIVMAPEIQQTSEFRRIMRRSAIEQPSMFERTAGLSRRLRFSLVNRMEWRRWHRDGVF